MIPQWVESIRQQYLTGEANMFIVHGNVHDDVWSSIDSKVPFLTMRAYVQAWAKKADKTFYCWNSYQEEGSFYGSSSDTLEKFQKALRADDAFVLLPHASDLFPNAEPQHRSPDERAALALMQDIAMSSWIREKNSVVVLVVESLSTLAPELLNNPRISVVKIDYPDLELRNHIIGSFGHTGEHQQVFAKQTAGLRAVQIASIFNARQGLAPEKRAQLIHDILVAQHAENIEERVVQLVSVTGGMNEQAIAKMLGHELPASSALLEVVQRRKRAIIEKECAGLIEFMDSKHGFDMVGGQELIKKELTDIARVIQSGNMHLAPMGLLAVGPMGSGKTFVIKAFLKEAGLTGVVLKNFRSKWVGSTESNLDKVLSTVKAMGPVAVVIDESDRSFGGQSDSDGGTSSRVIARLKEFMSDTSNRGQVVFILMTNRPDKLDTDLKRPGRLDRKIPFFYAQTRQEIGNILQALGRQYGVTFSGTHLNNEILEALIGYSNADLEALVGLYANLCHHGLNSGEAFRQSLADFIPPREPEMIHFMELLAVQEASRKSLVPIKYHSLYDGNALSQALRTAKQLLQG